jgi:hypothetical protein
MTRERWHQRSSAGHDQPVARGFDRARILAPRRVGTGALIFA